jgi:MiaB-like tRNA modifying enzyme
MKIYSESYGCSLNRGEAREMVETAIARGHSVASSPDTADVILLDCCAVIQGTENRMLARLKALGKNGKAVIVSGCLPQVRTQRVLGACPGAILIPPDRRALFNEILSAMSAESGVMQENPQAARALLEGVEEARRDLGWKPEVVEEVPIAKGCRGRCTYCIARLARGRLQSRDPDEILKRVNLLVERGCREVRLTAQDAGLYGLDIGTSISELVRRVCELEGDFRIRVGMMNPETLKPVFDMLMGEYEHPNVFNFLHIPVQSGDDAVLERMGRSYGADDFMDLAGRYRERFPSGLLSTDIIVGFPGEGEKEFERTLSLVERSGPDMVNVKAFSPRPGTDAAQMAGRPPLEAVKTRVKRLNELRRRISVQNNRRMVGRTEHVLVTERARGGVLARTRGYYPVFMAEKLTPGTFQFVNVVSARPGFLIGESA